MKNDQSIETNSRREFIKKLALTSTVAMFGFGGIFKIANARTMFSDPKDFEYKFSTVSVKHVPEIKEWLEKLNKEGKLSDNETYRSYIDFEYEPYKKIPNAKSIIIISIPQRIEKLICHKGDQQIEIMIPTGYLADGISDYMVKRRLMDEIIQDQTKQLEWSGLPLKTLAVRSGLAKYGKNNISYVNKYGSNHQLLGYYTDMELADNWSSLKLLRECKGCTICIKGCPNNCFKEDNFVVDIGRCLTLYNETSQDIPEFMDPKIHHTLVGCLKCQWDCPANEKSIQQIDILAELNNEETEFLLGESKDEAMHKVIIEKLKRFGNAKNLPYFRRNFKLAINGIMNS